MDNKDDILSGQLHFDESEINKKFDDEDETSSIEKKVVEKKTVKPKKKEVKTQQASIFAAYNVDEKSDNEEIVGNNEIVAQKNKSKSKKLDEDIKGGEIINWTLEEVLHNSMIPYTEHVVMDRALPRVEDGLKPVQRRILYTMLELNLAPDKQFRKSARIVGDCMGKYHPHGDSSVYDAMVRLSQNFAMREPLVLGHGNFGSIDGDSAAAMRYTEAKLTPLAMEMLRDLEKNTVHWSLNFDDTLKEPDMLPARFPNLLVNGTSGIAVGVATNIPPHNLNETINGVIAYIDNPKITLNEMMKIIPSPDFPTGGIIIAGEELEQAYKTGRGKIIVRAKLHIEEKGDKTSIVITEMPYQTNKAALLQKIAELKDEGKGVLTGISEIRDESDRNGMRAVIRVKKEANVKAIVNYLYKATGLQTTFGINMVAIAGGKPRQLGLLDIISYYVEYQREIVFRRTKFDLETAKDRAHIVEGLLIAIKNIDEVVKIIKKSASISEAKINLRSRFVLSEKQAQAILDMRLARLVNLEVGKLEEELKLLKIQIAELQKIYDSKRLQLNVVKSELGELKRRFKEPRRSTIEKNGKILEEIAAPLTKLEQPISAEPVDIILAITADGTIKNIPFKNYQMAQKDVGAGTSKTNIHTQILKVKSNEKVLIFTTQGNCIKVLAGSIPEAKWREKGCTLKAINKNVGIDEMPFTIISLSENTENSQLLMCTSLGMIKKSNFSDYDIAKSYFQAIKLKEGDSVVSVEKYVAGGSITMISKFSMLLNFEKTDIPVMGRVSSGVKGMNLEANDRVVFASQIQKGGQILLSTDTGFVKRVPISEFGLSVRYRKGLRAVSFNGKGKNIVYAALPVDNEGLVFAYANGFELISKTSLESRLAEGKRLAKAKLIGTYKYVF